MKKPFFIIIPLGLLLPLIFAQFQDAVENDQPFVSEMNFDKDWSFLRDSLPGENVNWEGVNLPHTARTEPLVVNDQWQGTCWYKKEFKLGEVDDKKVFLKFEGVMHSAKVWINNRLAKEHQGGYLPFSVDITDFIHSGEKNTILVQVNNEDNSAVPPGKPLRDLDFNYYGGIYRSVKLVTKEKLHITDPVHADKVASGGVRINFHEVSSDQARGTVQVHVQNDHAEERSLACHINVNDPEGRLVWQTSKDIRIKAQSDAELIHQLYIDAPARWSPQTPSLYQIELVLMVEESVVDRKVIKTGIRKAELTEEGFFLNDEKIFIRGTNRHQEYPYVGYALSEKAQYRDAFKIKEAGFDFVRLSHYPQDVAFLDACDELGLLVMNAIPGWQFFEEGEFVKNSYQDIRDLVRRDRNHPSIIFWEVSLNESSMTEDYMVRANEILKEESPFNDTYSAGWIDHEAFDLYIPARQHGKAPDYWTKYQNAGRQIFIAEYGDWEYYAQNAGFNQAAFEGLKEEERTSRQLRGHGEKRLLQQALNFQEAANSNRMGENTIGHANWLMFDYNRGYSDDLEASGISDIFRIPKFSYYFYQSQRPASETLALRNTTIGGPMVKIASYWNERSALDVKVFSNCDQVSLFLNDSLIAKKEVHRNQFSSNLTNPPFTFSINKFMKGTLVAKGYIGEKVVCEDQVTTADHPAKIEISIDESNRPLQVNGHDIVFAYAKILDANGNYVPSAEKKVKFEIEGEARLIGDNPAISEAGIATILLKVEGTGRVKITASAENLWGDSYEIKLKSTVESNVQ